MLVLCDWVIGGRLKLKKISWSFVGLSVQLPISVLKIQFFMGSMKIMCGFFFYAGSLISLC